MKRQLTARVSLRARRRTNTRAIANGRSNETPVESSAADKLEPVTGRNYALIVKF